MAIVEDIQRLRDRALADLAYSHDYYTDTKIAWLLVQQVVADGHKIANQSHATGTVTTQTELAIKSYRYVDEELSEATFQQFVSILESFWFLV